MNLKGRAKPLAEYLPAAPWLPETGMDISTGFPELDRLIGGLRKGNLILLAGNAGIGKTSLALGLASHAALQEGKRVLFLTQENRPSLALRLLCAHAGVDIHLARLGKITESEEASLALAREKLSRSEIYFPDSPDYSLEMVQHMAGGAGGVSPDFLIVDDILAAEDFRVGPGSRTQRALRISEALKDLALQRKFPVLALCRKRRASEDGYEGLGLGLPDGAALAEFCDCVLVLDRDAAKDPYAPSGLARITVPWNRNGPTGQVLLVFQAGCARFREYSAQALAQVNPAPGSLETLAQEEALRRNRPIADTGDLWLALIRENGAAVRMLEKMGMDTEKLAQEMESENAGGDRAALARRILVNPRLQEVLGRAMMESLDAGGGPDFGSEHALLALLRDSSSPAAKKLAVRGITFDRMKAELSSWSRNA